jgi:hypothetical protein
LGCEGEAPVPPALASEAAPLLLGPAAASAAAPAPAAAAGAACAARPAVPAAAFGGMGPAALEGFMLGPIPASTSLRTSSFHLTITSAAALAMSALGCFVRARTRFPAEVSPRTLVLMLRRSKAFRPSTARACRCQGEGAGSVSGSRVVWHPSDHLGWQSRLQVAGRGWQGAPSGGGTCSAPSPPSADFADDSRVPRSLVTSCAVASIIRFSQ